MGRREGVPRHLHAFRAQRRHAGRPAAFHGVAVGQLFARGRHEHGSVNLRWAATCVTQPTFMAVAHRKS